MGEKILFSDFRMFIKDPYKFTKKHRKSRLRFLLAPSSWFFQGQLYADKTEKTFKILIDLILILAFYIVLINYTNFLASLLFAFILAHTLNWLFNSNFLNIFNKKYGLSIRIFVTTLQIEYVNELRKRITNESSIQCAAIYGSLSRKEINETSDLDMRVIRKPGIINGFRACMFALFERNRATFNKFPLDLFIFDSKKSLLKLRGDEAPVILHDPERMLEKLYPKVTYF